MDYEKSVDIMILPPSFFKTSFWLEGKWVSVVKGNSVGPRGSDEGSRDELKTYLYLYIDK